MTLNMVELLDAAKKVEMTPMDKEEQRRSFVYGNTSIENTEITRELVDVQADLLRRANG